MNSPQTIRKEHPKDPIKSIKASSPPIGIPKLPFENCPLHHLEQEKPWSSSLIG